MIKQMAWNIFKNTGDINTFLELRQLQELEQNREMVNNNELNKNTWNNNSRE